MIPRPYQLDAINALWRLWKMSPSARPLIVAPTGAATDRRGSYTSELLNVIKEDSEEEELKNDE